MSESPMTNSSAVLKLSVFSNDTQIQDTIGIASISITSAINKIPYAIIELPDGDMPNQDFPISNGDEFKPGSEIKINAGYGDSEDTIFKGIVIKHGIKISGNNTSRLVIECRDKAVAMTIGRHSANYVDKKDSEIIADIVSGYSGLSSDVDVTTTQYKELVQYYCSDWDFILSRAEVNGLLICVEDGKLSIKAPQLSAAAELKLSYGEDLIELDADIDARTQFTEVKATSWDPGEQKVVEEPVGPQTLNEQGDLQAADLAGVIDLKSLRLQTTGVLESSALKDWAAGKQLKAGLARIRGRMKFQGSAMAKIGSLIELNGVGSRFNGDVFVSSVTHRIISGNWISDVDFGMSPDWFSEQRNLVAPPASGFLPGIEGLQIGVVLKLDEDPEGQSRVQVSVPILQAETEGVWARLSNFAASNSFGAFFIPEIGDEVILGYLNNDPSNPIVLGSLYSSKQVPPYELTAKNYTKAIVTKEKLSIEFDDEKKTITITTPGENKVVLSDDKKSILLQDQNGNKVELNETGIVLDSPKDIAISAEGKVTIDATGNIEITSKADVNVQGMNVNLTADTGFTAKGSATAELSASGDTTIKGAMVMIN
jgi:Rhs element Vgr protein